MEINEHNFASVNERHQLIKDTVALGFAGTNTSVELAYRKLSDLHYADPKYLSVVHQTLTTGSETGRNIALVNFREIVSPPHNFYDRDRAQSMRDHLLRVWCVGNVAEAIGHEAPDSLLDYSKEALCTLIDEGMTSYADERSDTFWHGLVVLVNIITHADGMELRDSGPFIPWAGNRSDWKDIIRVGRERNSIDPSVIEAILSEEARVAAPMKDGVL